MIVTYRAASLRNKGSFIIFVLRLGLALLAIARRPGLSYSIAPNRESSSSASGRRGMSSSTYFVETKAAGTTVEITFDEDGKSPHSPSKYGLGYWSIRGLGAPVTMMMCAAKIPFTLFLYDIVEKEDDGADGGGGWHSDYFAAK